MVIKILKRKKELKEGRKGKGRGRRLNNLIIRKPKPNGREKERKGNIKKEEKEERNEKNEDKKKEKQKEKREQKERKKVKEERKKNKKKKEKK